MLESWHYLASIGTALAGLLVFVWRRRTGPWLTALRAHRRRKRAVEDNLYEHRHLVSELLELTPFLTAMAEDYQNGSSPRRVMEEIRALKAMLRVEIAHREVAMQLVKSYVVRMDSQGMVTWVSRSLSSYLHVSPEVLYGVGWLLQIVHDEDRQRVRADWTDALAAGNEFFVMVRTTRELVGAGIRFLPVRDPEAAGVDHWLGVIEFQGGGE